MLACPVTTTFVTLHTVISWSTLYKELGPHQSAAVQTYTLNSIAGLLAGFILGPGRCRTRTEGKSQNGEQFSPTLEYQARDD